MKRLFWILGTAIAVTMALTTVAVFSTKEQLEFLNTAVSKMVAVVASPALLIPMALIVVGVMVFFVFHITAKDKKKPIQKTSGRMDDIAQKDPDTEKVRILKGLLAVCAVAVFIGFLAPRALGVNWGIVATILSAAYLYLSLDEVNADEHAIVLFFGRILFQAKEGWIVVPAGLFSIARVTRGLMRGEFGTPFTRRVDKEGNVVEVEDEGNVNFTFRQPFRPNFQGMKTLYEKNRMGPVDQSEFPANLRFQAITNDVLKELGGEAEHKPQTPDLRYVFTFKVVSMIHFFTNVEGNSIEEKLLNVAQLISDQSKAAISEIAGITSFGLFLTEQAKASARVRHRVEILLGEKKSFSDEPEIRKRQKENYPYLGVDLNNTRMKDPGFPLRVNEAMANAAAAGHEKQKVILASEGEQIKLSNEGRGRAEAKKAELIAEADGLLKLAEAAAASDQGMEIIRLRSFVEGMKTSKAVILPADLSVLGSLVTAVKPILQPKP